MIHVTDFHKAYGSTVAVDGISFEVSPGQILGLIGPNGAGKTTTMRALAGIVPASRGRLLIDDLDIEQEPVETKRRLAFVPDDPPLFNDLTVNEHLAFMATAYGVVDAEPKANQLLASFELSTRRETPACDLSRGMRQKLALCCSLVYDPIALLLDEPMTGLDPRGIRTLKQMIAERAERGAAVIVSSHLLAMVEDICTHLLILAEGRQRFCGPTEELKQIFSADTQAASLEEIFFEATAETQVTTTVAIESDSRTSELAGALSTRSCR